MYNLNLIIMTTNKFESVNAALAAIQENNVLTPSIPVSVFVQEAEDLKKWAEVDKDVLIAHGLDWTLVESITERAAVCREAQSVWSREYKSREEAQHEWLRKSPEAFRLRDYLMNAFRYAFRKDRSLLEKVSAIARGNTREDMIQDLNDLAVLGRATQPCWKPLSLIFQILSLPHRHLPKWRKCLRLLKEKRVIIHRTKLYATGHIHI
jgi:hypothetical protein